MTQHLRDESNFTPLKMWIVGIDTRTVHVYRDLCGRRMYATELAIGTEVEIALQAFPDIHVSISDLFSPSS